MNKLLNYTYRIVAREGIFKVQRKHKYWPFWMDLYFINYGPYSSAKVYTLNSLRAAKELKRHRMKRDIEDFRKAQIKKRPWKEVSE